MWTFYTSLGKIIGGFFGAWLFYDSTGAVQSTFVSAPGVDEGEYFANRFFAPRYFNNRYFG